MSDVPSLCSALPQSPARMDCMETLKAMIWGQTVLFLEVTRGDLGAYTSLDALPPLQLCHSLVFIIPTARLSNIPTYWQLEDLVDINNNYGQELENLVVHDGLWFIANHESQTPRKMNQLAFCFSGSCLVWPSSSFLVLFCHLSIPFPLPHHFHIWSCYHHSAMAAPPPSVVSM